MFGDECAIYHYLAMCISGQQTMHIFIKIWNLGRNNFQSSAWPLFFQGSVNEHNYLQFINKLLVPEMTALGILDTIIFPQARWRYSTICFERPQLPE